MVWLPQYLLSNLDFFSNKIFVFLIALLYIWLYYETNIGFTLVRGFFFSFFFFWGGGGGYWFTYQQINFHSCHHRHYQQWLLPVLRRLLQQDLEFIFSNSVWVKENCSHFFFSSFFFCDLPLECINISFSRETFQSNNLRAKHEFSFYILTVIQFPWLHF